MTTMPTKNSVLVVCTANICRSPMAEKLLQHALAAEKPPLNGLRITSAGVAAGPGQPATDHSVSAVKKVGLDLSKHQSTPLTQAMLDDALAVYCMTETHRALIELQFERVPANLHLFREFVVDSREHEIPDPYGQNYTSYVACRDSMVEAIPSLVRHLRKLLESK